MIESFDQFFEQLVVLKKLFLSQAPKGPEGLRSVAIEEFINSQMALSCRHLMANQVAAHKLDMMKATQQL